MDLKVGDTAFVEYLTFFDIHEVVIIRETNNFFVFNKDNKDIRRKKNRFAKTKVELLERKLEVLNYNLGTLKTSGYEIYKALKEIDEKYPELLI